MRRRPEPELMDLPEEARVYAQADFTEVNRAFVDRALKLAGDGQNLRVLDLGTGPAAIPILIAEARPTWQITALDVSEPMLLIARAAITSAGVGDRVRVPLADAKSTGLPDASFDLIISNSLLHHMPDPAPLWREIKRLAAPRALVFLRDLMRPRSPEQARRLVQLHALAEPKLLQEEFHRSLLAAFTVEEVREQLRAAKLRSLNVQIVSDRHLDVLGRV